MYGDTWDKGIDTVAIERALYDPGACPVLTDEEQRRAVVVMTEAGRSAGWIGTRLGMDERTVDRWRQDMGVKPCSG
ncbi:hypothetical protein ACFWAP_03955 [Streptomyces goshikiensis]|uniref:hypothetical protein n=1 Tax=Streptomyces goshikiensis TaxID=1942 RepID=UPI00365EA610